MSRTSRPSTQKRSGRCWACGEPHLSVGDPPEHVVPSALGGALTTDRFAEECNRELGRRVDQPFMRDFMVANSRARHQIRDPRRPKRPPPSLRQSATDEEGRPVIVDWATGETTLPPYFTETEGGLVVSAGNEAEARRAAEAKVERLRRQGQNFKATPELTRVKGEEPLEAKFAISLSSTIRPRMAAKIALGAFSLALPEDWLDTDAARLLQSWLWEEYPKTAEGGTIFAGPKRPEDPIDKFCRPPEHLLFFLPGQENVNFSIVLFGEEVMVVSAGPLEDPAPRSAWCLDPVAGSYEESTYEDLVMRAREAYAEGFAEAEREPD